MNAFPIFNQHVSHSVRTSLNESPLAEKFATFLSCHKHGEAGELGPEQTAINRAIVRRWQRHGRQNVDETVRSEFVLEPGLSIVILTCRHFTTVFAKDEYHAWTPESMLTSLV